MKQPLIALCAALALTACATPTVYGPAGSGRVGFTDYRIEKGRYRVTFTGGPGAPAAQVADYALLRAAEVTLRDGFDWFRVVERINGRVTPGSSGPRVSLGTGTSSWGRRSSVGVGIGTSFDLSGGPALSRTLEVLAGKGQRPNAADIYDARDIIAVIGRGESPGAR